MEAVDQGVADKIAFLDKMRAEFLVKNKVRMDMWLTTNDPTTGTVMLPFHQDNTTGVCTWVNRKARREIRRR